ncbi:MAG TPA: M61 family peptidase [Blastocatellia bacterium]
MSSRISLLLIGLFWASFCGASVQAYSGGNDGVRTETRQAGTEPTGPIRLTVDARDATRGIFHAHIVMPAGAGPLTLFYPEWVPGEHGPTGPNLELAGLKVAASGTPIPWSRDPVDMFSFNLNVPAPGHLDVDLDYISPSTTISPNGYGFSPNATATLAIVVWNQLLLYPKGVSPADLLYQANLIMPDGWKYGTALPVSQESKASIEFSPVSLITLIDSPVIAGKYYRSIPLFSDGASSVEIDIAADSVAALAVPQELIEDYKRLVSEAYALFGAHHYRHYHFLLTLSDYLSFNGVEHHESSDDRATERMFLDSASFVENAALLPHEYTHSWNGKYQRPAGLATSDYQEPMKGNLLWVYEGLTQYLGDVLLTGRSGLMNEDGIREYIASVAAALDNEPGRTWRPVEDTAVAAQLLYGAPDEWASWRRGVDFYDEGLLIWLEADTVIRRESHGRHSLNDFCREFYGGPSGPPQLKTYTFVDVVAALNQVVPYDWAGFFRTRLTTLEPHAPLGGIEGGGWKLVYSDTPNWFIDARERADKYLDLTYSLGMRVKADGTVMDVLPGSPGAKSGLAPGMKIAAVNGRKWAVEFLMDTIASSKTSSGPIEILAENKGYISAFRVDYHGGQQYPHLERDKSKADLLHEILRPLSH